MAHVTMARPLTGSMPDPQQLYMPAPPPLYLQESALSKYAKKILLAPKPAPVLESMYKDRSQWQLGSLTHAINAEASGYVPLPDFPREAPDKTVRDVEDAWGKTGSGALSRKKKKKSEGDFYSSEDDSSDGSDFYSSISGSDESGSEEESGSGSEEGEGVVEMGEGRVAGDPWLFFNKDSESGSEEEDDDGVEETESEQTSSDEGDTLENLQKRFGVAPTKKKQVSGKRERESPGFRDTFESLHCWLAGCWLVQVSSESETSGTEDSEEDSSSEEEESSSEEETPITKPSSKASKKPPAKKKDDLTVEPRDSSLLDLDDCE